MGILWSIESRRATHVLEGYWLSQDAVDYLGEKIRNRETS